MGWHMNALGRITLGMTFVIMPLTLPVAAQADRTKNESPDEEVMIAALEMAKAERFDTALTSLSTLNLSTQNSYQFRFTKARILTWAQRYSEAEGQYNYLMANYPENPDVNVSFGFLELFRGNLESAELNFISVIEKYPNYTDAHRGLLRVASSRQNIFVKSNKVLP